VSQPDDTRPRILIVDDVEDNREMYAMYLEWAGYRVEATASGTEALDLAQRLIPAVIVLDLSMPGLDGWQVCRFLKGMPGTKNIPVIALTGHALDGAEAAARAAGCDAYLTKPCLPEDLDREIRRLLAARRPA